MAGPFDLGRFWSLAALPTDRLQSRYAAEPTDEWRKQVRRGVVRLPGCTGTLASEKGLVLTTADCVRSALVDTRAPDSIYQGAFHAPSPSQELQVSGLVAERVVGIEDVTNDVQVRRDSLEEVRGGDAQGLRREARAIVQRRRQAQAEKETRVEVVGERGRSVEYRYRRYDDLRLTFLPERALSRFGTPENAFAYPRPDWKGAILRIYEDGVPLDTPDHLSIRGQGGRPGDGVFALGFPNELHRERTAAQADFRREVLLPAERSVLDTWTNAVEPALVDTTTRLQVAYDEGRTARRRTGILETALQNEYFVGRLQAKDASFENQDEAGAEALSQRRALLDSIAALQAEKRAHAASFRAFRWLEHPTYGSATLRRALAVVRASRDGPSSAPGRDTVRAVPPQPASVDAALLSARIRRAKSVLEDPALQSIPDSAVAPSAIETRLEASVLRKERGTAVARRGGSRPDEDPVLRLVQPLLDAYLAFRDETDALLQTERQLTRELLRHRETAAAQPVALPRRRSLRVTDGSIQGYPSNGTIAPPFTTFYGLYARQATLGETGAPWRLPSAWQNPPEAFARSVPLTTIGSVDVGPGMEGGALVTPSLQVVGLLTGPNKQAVAGDAAFLPDRMRAVALDVRGFLEGLRAIYGADRLVQELAGSADQRAGASPSSDRFN